ncbi:hypothetical protein P0W64_09815 [Tsukamurella sp. 8F]|uniref:hypothetical protein n=1 Tax=unclassified Tsukamurella TaxID=2633480 RepID=UPI0023B8A4B3|nr:MULTISPECIES: hypothetical protein [unclassified Tsukamurella]MDF0529425.1 hypothetical protein [Tsukamurella sp. 8J]MDF0587068.1 hypothetical protein [Tsukamurella sp. 8F]
MGSELLEYWFGSGDGAVHTWRSAADGGHVRLDFDGDGRVDDAMIDVDGDGRADLSALDLDDDGVLDAFFADDGTGVWGLSREGPHPGRAPTAPGSTPPGPVASPGGSGEAARTRATVDADGDGYANDVEAGPIVWSGVSTNPDESGARQVYADIDGDGQPDVVVFDADGDGVADGAVALHRTVER